MKTLAITSLVIVSAALSGCDSKSNVESAQEELQEAQQEAQKEIQEAISQAQKKVNEAENKLAQAIQKSQQRIKEARQDIGDGGTASATTQPAESDSQDYISAYCRGLEVGGISESEKEAYSACRKDISDQDSK